MFFLTPEKEIKQHPMGKAARDASRVGCTSWTFGCDRTVNLEFVQTTVRSDAGLFRYRDLENDVQLTESIAGEQIGL